MISARDKQELVSIIIPMFNEENNIINCLNSLAKQTYKNIEIILVDDFSSDNTVSRSNNVAKNLHLKLIIISQKTHHERGITRNVGAKAAKGKWLLFLDADMFIDKNVIEECIGKIGSSELKAIIIPEESYGKGFWTECRKLEKRCYLKDDAIEAARFFNKEIFWKIGGWDEKMISGEDWDLTRRVREKWEIGRISSKIFHNEGNLTIWKVARKKFYYASESGRYLKKYPLKFKDLIFFIIRPAYIKNWRILIADPIHLTGLIVLKSIELLSGAAGFLYSKLPSLP